ncbi:unnamed protein product [Protopolystoma xenopodis]|uniref:Uncharacterized protein n=1 Tax=Protopolystoma xenopodis TaxID=117903 RepID=A0A448XLI8_9PLAT|nr:unnamed protein product [Protopolystoma xenopodis]
MAHGRVTFHSPVPPTNLISFSTPSAHPHEAGSTHFFPLPAHVYSPGLFLSLSRDAYIYYSFSLSRLSHAWLHCLAAPHSTPDLLTRLLLHRPPFPHNMTPAPARRWARGGRLRRNAVGVSRVRRSDQRRKRKDVWTDRQEFRSLPPRLVCAQDYFFNHSRQYYFTAHDTTLAVNSHNWFVTETAVFDAFTSVRFSAREVLGPLALSGSL